MTIEGNCFLLLLRDTRYAIRYTRKSINQLTTRLAWHKVSAELKYINEENKKNILEKINHESRMIASLIKKLNKYILFFWRNTQYAIRNTIYEMMVPKVGVEPTRTARLAGF